jgi:hypothetical protein
MRPFNSFLLALSISLLILVAGLIHALKQHFPYAPQINAEQKADSTFKGDKKSEKEGNPSATHQIDRRENLQEAENEGTEFWPPFVGLRLKITDSLLAVFTLGLLVFTALLWGSTDNLWKAGERQLKLIEAEFVSAHRPRLIVRHVGLAADHALAVTTILMGHDADIRGSLSIVNGGATTARIVRATCKIYFSNIGLPVRSPLMYENPSVLLEPKTVIKGGESTVIEIWDKVDFGPPDSTGLRNIRQFEDEGWIVYVMGEIRYQDDSGADHFMGFCRERQSNGRFRAVDDPDYEYQD